MEQAQSVEKVDLLDLLLCLGLDTGAQASFLF